MRFYFIGNKLEDIFSLTDKAYMRDFKRYFPYPMKAEVLSLDLREQNNPRDGQRRGAGGRDRENLLARRGECRSRRHSGRKDKASCQRIRPAGRGNTLRCWR